MSRLYVVTGPPGYVYLTRNIGPRWASNENIVAMVRPEEGGRIVAIVDDLARSREKAIQALRDALASLEE